jgi:hypothetical protein
MHDRSLKLGHGSVTHGFRSAVSQWREESVHRIRRTRGSHLQTVCRRWAKTLAQERPGRARISLSCEEVIDLETQDGGAMKGMKSDRAFEEFRYMSYRNTKIPIAVR